MKYSNKDYIIAEFKDENGDTAYQIYKKGMLWNSLIYHLKPGGYKNRDNKWEFKEANAEIFYSIQEARERIKEYKSGAWDTIKYKGKKINRALDGWYYSTNGPKETSYSFNFFFYKFAGESLKSCKLTIDSYISRKQMIIHND